MTGQERNPCGTAHPLPCGLDVACPESDYVPADALEELVEELRETASDIDNCVPGLVHESADTRKALANNLESVIEEHTNE